MKKFVSLALLAFASLFLFSCQKEISFDDPSMANGGTNTGNGGSTGSAQNSYFPLTSGTWWKYKDSLSGMTSVGTAASRTKTFNNIVYNAIVSVAGGNTDTAWAAAPKPNYYMTAKGISPSGAPYDILFHYLNDTASVGYNWTYDAGTGNGFKSIIKTTVIAKGLTMTVAGKTFKDVIQTKLEISYDVLGTIIDMGHYNYFTAKGIGVIKIRSDLSMMGVPLVQTCSDLIDYSIK